MDCGKSHETGSQIFFECPRNGNWMSATDRCRFDETEQSYINLSIKKQLYINLYIVEQHHYKLIKMLCEDCGKKLIVISTSYGFLAYCPDCCDPEIDKVFMRRRK